jgi:hypothetical protein
LRTTHINKLFVSIFRDLSDKSGLNTGWADLGQGHFLEFCPANILILPITPAGALLSNTLGGLKKILTLPFGG